MRGAVYGRHDEILNSSAIGFDPVLIHCEWCLWIASDDPDCCQLVLMVLQRPDWGSEASLQGDRAPKSLFGVVCLQKHAPIGEGSVLSFVVVARTRPSVAYWKTQTLASLAIFSLEIWLTDEVEKRLRLGAYFFVGAKHRCYRGDDCYFHCSSRPGRRLADVVETHQLSFAAGVVSAAKRHPGGGLAPWLDEEETRPHPVRVF